MTKISHKKNTLYTDWKKQFKKTEYYKSSKIKKDDINIDKVLYPINKLTNNELEKCTSYLNKWTELNYKNNIQRRISFKTVLCLALIFSQKKINLSEVNMDLGTPFFNTRNKMKGLLDELDCLDVIPKHYLDNMEKWNTSETKVIFHLLKGNSIRDLKTITLSKKEAYMYMNAPSYEHAINNYGIFEHNKYINYCKIIKSRPINTNFINTFFNHRLAVSFDETNIGNEIVFWRNIYNKLYDFYEYDSTIDVRTFVDYILEKHKENSHFSLKNVNLERLKIKTEYWHNILLENVQNVEFEMIKAMQGQSFVPQPKEWTGSKTPDTIINYDKGSYQISQIKTKDRLSQEGKNLKHCVNSYHNSCSKGVISIWNLQKTDTSVKEGLTVEIRNKKMIQVKGYRNRNSTELEKKVLNKWLKNQTIENPILN